MNSLYQASINFTSQNVGAGKTKRIVSVLFCCLGTVTAVGLGLGALATLFGENLLGIYSSDPYVISYGLIRLKLICITYFLCGLMDVACGSIRGLGYSITPTVVSLLGACAFRVLWIYTVFRADHSLFTLYVSYPVSWIITFLAHMACFAVFYRKYKLRIRQKDMLRKLDAAGHEI